MSKLIKNSARCKHCGVEIESKSRHDFRAHSCAAMDEAGFRRTGIRKPDGFVYFFVDGGHEYCRYGGHDDDYLITSIYDSDLGA